MTPILLDTDVLIDYLRDAPAAVRLLDPRIVAGEPVAASVISKAEVLAGMRTSEEERTVRTLGSLALLAVNDAIATRAGALARHYRSSHPGIGLADYLIAATAVLLNAELWTQNPRHFPMFGGLEPPYER
ncbi:MAG: type II toxin-antitoxin system VapC family toxin [Actinomycetota bacterium]|nr:type II toxin-antitoxin system VapC family toxin [Actinomycetota bacterium]